MKRLILVGESRICQQIAYVLKYENYEIVAPDVDLTHYADAKIVVCAFKRQSKIRVPKGQYDLTYLDDICRWLDRKFPRHYFWIKGNSTNVFKKNFKNIRSRVRSWLTFKSFRIINKMPVRWLKASELLIKVIYNKPTNMVCHQLEKFAMITKSGDVYGCCEGMVKLPFGNICEQNGKDIYDYAFARIIKLSSLNRSYCLCDLRKCQFVTFSEEIDDSLKELNCKDYPEEINIAYDCACNLRCPSCRRHMLTTNTERNKQVDKITNSLQQTGWLAKSNIILAGMGEVFYSPHYRQLLTTDIKRKQIHILSNGTLFNLNNWQLLADHYEKIYIVISIDAASENTYRKIRCGGNFQILLDNLKMLSELRQNNKIYFLQLDFVVQRDNYREMIDFVKLGQSLHVDLIQFTRLNNWGTYRRKEYQKKCLIIKNKYLVREFYEYLQNPIFKDPIVDLVAFQPYLNNSEHYYRKHR